MRKVCIRLYEEDLVYCEGMSETNPDLGVNFLLRRMVHTVVLQLKEKERQKLDKIDHSLAINLEEFESEVEEVA
jgi:hypothetical protein